MYDTDDLDYDDEDDGYDKKSKKRGRYADDDETSEDDVMAERIITCPPIHGHCLRLDRGIVSGLSLVLA